MTGKTGVGDNVGLDVVGLEFTGAGVRPKSFAVIANSDQDALPRMYWAMISPFSFQRDTMEFDNLDIS